MRPSSRFSRKGHQLGDRRTDITGRDVLRTCRVSVPVADLLREPGQSLSPETQMLFGETVHVLEEAEDWHKAAWTNAYSGDVDYIGWVRADALRPLDPEPDHWITALRAPVFSKPDLKSRITHFLPLGGLVVASEDLKGEQNHYREIATGGYVNIRHMARIGEEWVEDFVDTAETLQALPYVWGGNGPDGMDCSGLVRMSLHSAGIPSPRDADQQEAALGESVEPDAELMNLRRGDLVFWPGHVGIMQTSGRLLHANGHHMCVAIEPLREVVERIGSIRTVKRL